MMAGQSHNNMNLHNMKTDFDLASLCGSSEVMTAACSLSSDSSVEQYPELHWNDIRVGGLIGKGGFSKVKTATFRNKRRFGKDTYAVKFLRNSTLKRNGFAEAAVDLVAEGRLLSHLRHENIVKIYGQGCLENAYDDNDHRHFLILERLDNDTLDDLIENWSWTNKRLLGMDHYGTINVPSKVERIEKFALPVARALGFLHSNQVCLRDLKPQNVGFRHGTVKLMDFGLARTVTKGRKLSGHVGSPLYMAPETMLSQEYGLPVDVYSFSVFLWELLTLEQPYKDAPNTRELEKMVAQNHLRPTLGKTIGSTQIRDLLARGWDRDPDVRPTFDTIVRVLENEVESRRRIDTFGRTSASKSGLDERRESHGSRARAA